MILDIIALIIKNLKQRKIRTFLTLLGVIIGIAALVGMVGATQGINQAIYEQLKAFRSDWIFILPGKLKFGFMPSSSSLIPTLKDKDIEVVSKVAGIKNVVGVYIKTLPVTYEKETLYLQVWGVQPEKFKEMDTLGLIDGRYLTYQDKFSALLGYSVAKEMFEDEVTVRKKILINGKEFRVVGIRNKYGGFFSQLEDQIVLIPIKTMEDEFLKEKGVYRLLIVQVEEGADMKKVEEELNFELCKERKSCGDEDFFLVTPEYVQSTVSQISFLLTVMLGGIASISLVVGMIGIANTMYTSVLERTREIGILKAIGATPRTIMLMFVLESGIIGLIGGVVGIVLGYGMGEGFLIIRRYMISQLREFETASMAIAHMSLTLELIAGSLLLSFLVGVIAGIFPARKAAKLQPVEALRYE
ncbi:MAG: ABC transporter permease [Candidatus Aenigmarchaeota archaeon]|nr:ABC transporter permease [Candidatus Aenigmarchaeota archaeon]